MLGRYLRLYCRWSASTMAARLRSTLRVQRLEQTMQPCTNAQHLQGCVCAQMLTHKTGRNVFASAGTPAAVAVSSEVAAKAVAGQLRCLDAQPRAHRANVSRWRCQIRSWLSATAAGHAAAGRAAANFTCGGAVSCALSDATAAATAASFRLATAGTCALLAATDAAAACGAGCHTVGLRHCLSAWLCGSGHAVELLGCCTAAACDVATCMPLTSCCRVTIAAVAVRLAAACCCTIPWCRRLLLAAVTAAASCLRRLC